MTACPVDAIGIAATGAKVVSADQCVGCKLCTIACPYGTMFLLPEAKKAIKCNLCHGNPACVQACPTGAIEYTETPSGDWLGELAAKRAAQDLTGRI